MSRIVVYTAVFGEGYGVVPQRKIDGVDFICFTDDIKKVPKPWKALLFDKEGLENHHKNRYVKLLPHKVLKDYDISIYIDSNFLIVGDIHALIQDLGEEKMAVFDHNQTDDKRDCIYEEYEAILSLGKSRGVFKDSPDVMKKQIDKLKSENYPAHNGLISGGVLVRKHHDKEVIKLMEDWWEMVSTMSKRDQLSFNYLTWKHDFKFKYIDGDLRFNNPYFYFLASARKNYCKSLLKYKLKKIVGLIKYPKA